MSKETRTICDECNKTLEVTEWHYSTNRGIFKMWWKSNRTDNCPSRRLLQIVFKNEIMYRIWVKRGAKNMIIYKCDRCKKESKNSFDLTNVTIGNLFSTKYELCDGCIKELKQFIKPNECECQPVEEE